MFELAQDTFFKVRPLCQVEETHFPLIQAVIQKKQQGWIFVDKPDDPVSALVITKFGFMQMFGVEHSEDFDADIVAFFSQQDTQTPSYLMWYSPSPQWQNKLNAFVPGQVRRRERMRFIFNDQQADYLGSPVDCPADFKLRLLDEKLLEKSGSLKLAIDSRFWSSTDDFLKNGLGVCLITDGEIASLCYSACVVDRLAEIDIVTREEYREKGLASVVARRFIQECRQRGILPTWDCFIGNIASMKLAIKLGFIQDTNYLFYSFNTPLYLNNII
jgi:GNAT superfamily N-acetyltransferase